MSANTIDTTAGVVRLIDDIVNTPKKPFIFVDLEGINLSRHGSICVMQLLTPPIPVVHLIDIFSLQDQAFKTAGADQITLKDLLESEEYVKVFFDVRNDSDALFSHFNVKLNGVLDLQLVEYASRPSAGRLIKGLAKCISEDHPMSWMERQKFNRVKEAGQKLFAPEKGGAYSVFKDRPMSDALREYCVQDVMVLPKLLSTYAARIRPHMVAQVVDESKRRVAQSQGVHFNGKGSHMALAPSLNWTRPTSVPILSESLGVLYSGNWSASCEMQELLATPPKSEPATAANETAEQLQQLKITSDEEEKKPANDTPAPAPVADAMRAMGSFRGTGSGRKQAWHSTRPDEDDFEYKPESDDETYSRYSREYEDGDSGRDYTACSASDCGYCGRCDY